MTTESKPSGDLAAADPCTAARAPSAPTASPSVGDAAGYVDAITGEGISLSLTCAAALCAVLPQAISSPGDPHALRPYACMQRQAFFRYAVITKFLVTLAARPGLRRRILRLLARVPSLFGLVLRWVMKRSPPAAAADCLPGSRGAAAVP